MTIETSKQWCLRMVEHEGDAEITAGQTAINPLCYGECIPANVGEEASPNVAADRVVNLMRQRRGRSQE